MKLRPDGKLELGGGEEADGAALLALVKKPSSGEDATVGWLRTLVSDHLRRIVAASEDGGMPSAADCERCRPDALVVGSGRSPYAVSIDIKTMAKAKWDGLVQRMSGKVSSLMALAAGKLPKELLEDFCNAETGLFPKPREISFSCSCPDGADCCKHVAAVLYGIGARLDDTPELFFTLRGVDAQSIISAATVVDTLTADASSELASDDLSDVFGISLDEEISAAPEPAAATEKAESKTVSVKAEPKTVPEKPLRVSARKKSVPTRKAEPIGDDVAAFFRETRKRLRLTQAQLATRLGTNQTTISVIERGGKCPRATVLGESLKKLASE